MSPAQFITGGILFCPHWAGEDPGHSQQAGFSSWEYSKRERKKNITTGTRQNTAELYFSGAPQVPQLLDFTAPSAKTRISILSIHPSWWTANHYKSTLREKAFEMPKKWNLEQKKRQSHKEMRWLPVWGTCLQNTSLQVAACCCCCFYRSESEQRTELFR